MDSRFTLALAGAVALLVLAAGCGGDGGGDGGATVTGQAIDDGRLEAGAGAVARVGGKTSAPTAANGIFTIAGTAAGPQTLTVTAPGHQSSQRSVTLSRGANDVGVFYLPPNPQAGRGAITGTVVLAGSNTPVGGAVIRSGTTMGLSRSDGTGRFTLYNIGTGMVQVTFTDPATGAGSWRYVSVDAGGDPADVGTVALSMGPPPPPI
jgi:hypothetical protein